MKQLLVIVAKQPLLNFSKTRLAKDIGSENAQKFSEAFLSDILFNLENEIPKFINQIFLYITPATENSFSYFQNLVQKHQKLNFTIRPQPETSFFDRLKRITEELEAEFGKDSFVHFTGSDVPDFPWEILNEGMEKPVIGPDIDGGYYYIGVPTNLTACFDQNLFLSGEKVFETTVKIIEGEGITPIILSKWSDIDELKDLERALARSERRLPNVVECYRRFLRKE